MARKGKLPTATAVDSEAPEAEAKTAPEPAEKVEKVAAETNGSSDEAKDSASADERKEDAVTEEKKEDAGTEEKTPKAKKPVKKTVPEWATLSDNAKKALPKALMAKPKIQDNIISAIKASGDSKGVASAGAIKKYVMNDNPDLPKMVLKKGIMKALEKGLIKQVKGKGFSGSFKLESEKNVAKAKAKETQKGKGKGKKETTTDKPPLETVFPGVFTWATNPKECSANLIKKYIAKHYPELDVEGNQFRKAIEGAEAKGQLKRITGKGFSGTFELVDGANKTGAKYEDAIENAVISMNEPKQLSVNALRDYLSCWHSEYNTDNRPLVLKKALDRCSDKGWIKQISGKGFSGTYRLMHPYYPGPRELWGEDYQEENKKTEKETPRKAKKRAVVEDSEDEEEEESEEEFSDDDGEVMPTPKKRGAPKQRSAVVAKKKIKKESLKKTVTKPMKKKSKAKTGKAKPASKGKAKKNKR